MRLIVSAMVLGEFIQEAEQKHPLPQNLSPRAEEKVKKYLNGRGGVKIEFTNITCDIPED